MSTHDIHHESTPESRDERGCGHPHAEHPHAEHPHRGHRGHDRGFGPRRHEAFGPARGHRGLGPRPFGPGVGPDRSPDGEPGQRVPGDEHAAERRGARGRPRRLDLRILRTARIVAFAEHRAGREAVERTMAASVSHADHEATMRTLRTIARAVRSEHLPERGHGRRDER